jgi:hypothetical protein
MPFRIGRWLGLILLLLLGSISLSARAESAADDHAAAQLEIRRADALVRDGEYEGALDAYQNAFNLEPSSASLRGVAAMCAILRRPEDELAAHERLLRDYRDALSPQQIEHSEQRIRELSAGFGEIRFEGFDPGTRITVDGRPVGTLPLDKPLRLPTGPHDVEFSLDGYQPRSEHVELTATGASVSGPLVPVVSTGLLQITAATKDPKYAELPVTVYVDDKPVGSAPWSGALPEGTYAVRGANTKLASGVYSVRIVRGYTQRLDLDMTPLPATVLLTTEFGGVTLKLNGRVVGTYRYEGSVAPGSYEVVAEYPGYQPFVKSVTLEPGQHFELKGIHLEPPAAAVVPTPPPVPADETREPVTDESTETKPKADDSSEYEGMYGYLDLLGMVAPTSTHEWETNCPGTSCNTTAPLGGGLALRIGYSFGAVGLELMALGGVDYSSASTTLPQVADPFSSLPTAVPANALPSGVSSLPGGIPSQLANQLSIVRVGGILGGALRLTTETKAVRFTVAGGGGVALRTIFSNVSLADGSSQSYAAPALALDAGLLFGNFLHVGAFASFDFVDRVSVGLVPRNFDITQLPPPYDAIAQQQQSVDVFTGTQTFLGLLAGLHFGS